MEIISSTKQAVICPWNNESPAHGGYSTDVASFLSVPHLGLCDQRSL